MSSSEGSRRPSRRIALHVFAIGIAATGVVAGGLGWWIGRSSVPLISLTSTDCPTPGVGDEPLKDDAGPSASEVELAEALDTSLLSMLQLAAQVDSLEQVIEDFERQGIDPKTAARGLIKGMSEDDVDLIVGLVTRMNDEELDEIEDIRGYATRLSDIAIDGTFDETVEPTEYDGTILFGSERDEHDPASVAAEVFLPDTQRIFAMVPMPEGGTKRVTVKWARVDRREILRLRRRTIATSAPYMSFFLPRPSTRGWSPGLYRVTVYTGDEAMTLLAEGTYSVTEPPED